MVHCIRADHIGRPVFAANASGAKVWTVSYTQFGGVHTSSGQPIEARFPGQWYQSESGLHQNWMRDYDPTTGRYIQGDPLGLVDGASVYGYVRGNPGRWQDPRGEFGLPGIIFGAIIGGISAYNNGPCLSNVLAGMGAGALAGALGGLYAMPAAIIGAAASASGQLAGNSFAGCGCRKPNLLKTPGFWTNTALGGVATGFGPRVGNAVANSVWGRLPQFGKRFQNHQRTAFATEGAFDAGVEALGNLVPNSSDGSCCGSE